MKFYKRNWLGILGIIIGIAGLIAAFYFYRKSTAKPEPIFLADPSTILVVEDNRSLATPTHGVQSRGNIISDVIATRFYFWNDGRKSIRPSDILKPLTIMLSDPNGEILDYKIIKYSRDVVRPRIERNLDDPNNSLIISFQILEKDDGFAGQLLYRSKPKSDLIISGTIENVREIVTLNSDVQISLWKRIRSRIITPATTLFFFVVIFILYYSTLSKKDTPLTIREKLKQSYEASFIWLLMTVIFIAIISWQIRNEQREAPTAILKEVPQNIIP